LATTQREVIAIVYMLSFYVAFISQL